jgi:hypothetical protein
MDQREIASGRECVVLKLVTPPSTLAVGMDG